MEKKFFIITIDTESDNQWDSSKNQTTENARFIPRFQELCEKYGFKPVYLVDYSMAQNPFLVEYLKKCSHRGTCEVGMHLHAWDTPPHYEYDTCTTARPYLIEYPVEVMHDKIKAIHELLVNAFESNVVSHRAGRWATNQDYFKLLSEFGYRIDCSFTPGLSWKGSAGAIGGGSDYSKAGDTVSFVGPGFSLMEIPMTLKKVHRLNKPQKGIDLIKEPAKFIKGRYWWLRPALSSNEMMLEVIKDRKQDYAEFMMHSSEMMPGGSPYFKTEEDIERLYSNLEEFFKLISGTYQGCTLKEYYDTHK